MKVKAGSSPRSHFLTIAVAVLGVAGVSLPAARASTIDFTGSTVVGTLYNPNLSTILGGPTTAVVGASNPTFPAGSIIGNTAFQINITADQIIYDPLTTVTYGNGQFNGFVFQFSGAPTISNVTLDASSTFAPTAISFTDNSVLLNLSADSVTSASQAVLDVSFAPVPLPASVWLLLSALGGLGVLMYRRSADAGRPAGPVILS